MDLYGFGFNGHSQLSDPSLSNETSSSEHNILTPKVILHGHSIAILWTSWCDALISIQSTSPPAPASPPKVLYSGTGLTKAQITHIQNLSQADANGTQFFGAPLADGLKGILTPQDPPTITFFASDFQLELELEANAPEIGVYSAEARDFRIRNITVTSGGHVTLVAQAQASASCRDTEEYVIGFASLEQFRKWLENNQSRSQSQAPLQPKIIATLPIQEWKQVLSNATTSTALTPSGQVVTWTQDTRYPKCLGRTSDPHTSPANIPSPIPYLSETKITKIASGGYMTAALSEDGELFLWGQACPGTDSELNALPQHPNDPRKDDVDLDEFVRCVSIMIRGGEARVTDVAIGSGHIIVAAEATSRGQVSRAVFAAGQCESGQLGIGETPRFVGEFVEVQVLRGKKVMSLAAAGWSSWVMVENDKELKA